MRVLLAVIMIFMANSAHALSCVAPELNDKIIEKAEVIFVGKILEVNFGTAGADGGYNLEKAVMEVTNRWKGVEVGQKIEVYRNAYWGDKSAVGKKYLVVTSKSSADYYGVEGEIYVAPYCKNIGHYWYDQNNIQKLKEYFSPDCEAQEASMRASVEIAQPCKQESDCKLWYPFPFGCAASFVDADGSLEQRFEKDLEDYRKSSCPVRMYKCAPIKAVCEAGMCAVKREY